MVNVDIDQHIRTLIREMPDFVNYKDGNGRWLIANDFALQLYQLERVDFIGKTDRELADYADFFRPALLACEASDEQTWASGRTTRVEERTPMQDGTTRVFDVFKVPLFYADGSRQGLVVIGRDITNRVNAENLLIKAEKLSIVGELAAGIAHEIRNPLTALKGFVQLMSKTANGKDSAYLTVMFDELKRIESIVNEFLVLAKPTIEHHRRHLLKDILNEVCIVIQPHASIQNVKIEISQQAQTPTLLCDKNRMKQVFVNLLKNAVEAMPEGGVVQIDAKQLDDNQIAIYITDHGMGIHEDDVNKIGEPFYTTKPTGTGLGLMVTERILESHGGSLRINSEVGLGTTVRVSLPL